MGRIWLIAFISLAACGDDNNTTGSCVPGASVACACTNGAMGAQVCGADHTFAACMCDGLDDAGVDAPLVDAPPDAVDAPPDADFSKCDPTAPPGQQGCPVGDKCTWVQVQDNPVPLGTLDCVPDGAVALGGACQNGPVGTGTGYDDCAVGGICLGGTCLDVCGFDGSAAAACASGYTCTRYSGLFANDPDDPLYGGCNPGCDPVTQQVAGGGACPGGQGCYLLTSSTTTVAVCAGAGNLTHGQTITGGVFANSCAPGHQPRRAGPPPSTAFECGALCQPADVTSTTNMTSEGGVAPYTCESKGAAPPDSATSGESCRYYWAREPFSEVSPYSNTVGWCFKHAIYQYDTNGDNIDDAPFPRCTTLTTGDLVPPIGNPPHNDAQYFWCVAEPVAKMRALFPKHFGSGQPKLDRLGGWRH